MILRISTVSLVLLVSPVAAASDCLEPGNVFEEYIKYQAIFVGTVKTFGKADSGHPIATLAVGETFRGDVGKTADVLVTEGTGRYEFEVNKTYIVYGSGKSPYNVLASDCGRTGKVTKAELRALRNISEVMTKAEATKAAAAYATKKGANLKAHQHISTDYVVEKHAANYWRVRYGIRPATPGGDFFVFVYSPEHIQFLPGR